MFFSFSYIQSPSQPYNAPREQFAFMVYCYQVKAIFHNLCTVLYWRQCGLTNSSLLLNTLLTEADVHGAQKVLSNNGFRMANCFCCLSQNAMELQQKAWKTARLFLQDQDQMFKTKTKTIWSKSKTKTKTFIFDLEAPWDQDPGLEDYITEYHQGNIACRYCMLPSFDAELTNSR